MPLTRTFPYTSTDEIHALERWLEALVEVHGRMAHRFRRGGSARARKALHWRPTRPCGAKEWLATSGGYGCGGGGRSPWYPTPPKRGLLGCRRGAR